MNNNNIYSDGVIEDEIINCLKENKNPMMEDTLKNTGAVFHNFSSARNGLIDWYDFREDAEVIELGAGMGALTGILCNKCKSVVSVEGSEKRAEIIKLRYKNKRNLEVISSDIYDLPEDRKFDYVLLVGVLEYAGVDDTKKKPHIEMLKKVKRLLKSNGIALIAIENRFGVKYWSGAAEDHTGVPFDGVLGYHKGGRTERYQKAGVETFSKESLTEILNESGFDNKRFYYPLPDYKFPIMIFSDTYLPTEENIRGIKFHYSDESMIIFDEKELYGEIIRNNVFPFFANSFLIEVSGKELDRNFKQFISNKRDYKDIYKLTTSIGFDNIVEKKISMPQAKKHIKDIAVYRKELSSRGVSILEPVEMREGLYERMNFVYAQKSDGYFRSLLKAGNMQDATKCIELLKACLLKSSDISLQGNTVAEKVGIEDAGYGSVLKHGYIDMTFVNSFYISEDKLLFFDQEWKLENIPLSYLLYRSIKYAYGNDTYQIPKEALLRYIGVDSKLYNIYEQFENDFLRNLMDEKNEDFFNRLLLREEISMPKDVKKFKQEILNKTGHIEQLLQSERDLKNKVMCMEEQLKNQEKKYSDLTNKEGHINQLLEVDREFTNIKNSRAWKMMNIMWRMSSAVIPRGSKRRLAVKVGYKFIRQPMAFLRKLSPDRIKKFFYYLRKEGVSGVSRRLDESVRGTKIKHQQITVNEIAKVERKFEEYTTINVPVFENPAVSIVIPVYNQFEFTYNCIQSIVENSGNISYEIIIANDCSTDLTTRIEELISGITVITNEKNLRFLLNCNHAAQYAKGKYILFLNNDTQVQKNWLAPLVELIERDEKIGMVGSKLVYPDGRLQEAGGILWKDGSAWNYGHLSDPNDPEYNYVKEVDYISGAAIMIRSVLWKEIGGFDERFVPAYCEDSDLAFEVRKHGYKVMYQPLSVVVHFEGVSNGTDTSAGQKKYQIVNSEKFFEKWKDTLEKENFQNAQNVFVARDRSRKKKTVVVVDHYVPTFDKDAGSRTVYQYIKLFVENGFNVKLIGDNFYQSEPYTTAFQQMGVEVLYGSYYASSWKTWIKENCASFNFFLLNRPHISVKYIDFIKAHTNAKVMYYGHDLHFLREYREYELTGDLVCKKSSDDWKKKELSLMRKADYVYYPSVIEENTIREIDDSINVKAIPAYIFDTIEKVQYDTLERKDIMFIGGFNHKPNVDGVLWFTNEILPYLVEELPDLKIHILGSNTPEEVKKIAGGNIIIEGFVTDEQLNDFYGNSLMSIVPLRYGAGIKGKVIEAMKNGVPVVTTSIGAEGILGAENVLCIEDDAKKFAQAIVDLHDDADRLKWMSQKSQEYIAENYSEKSAIKTIGKDFDIC